VWVADSRTAVPDTDNDNGGGSVRGCKAVSVAYSQWEVKARALNRHGWDITVSDWVERHATSLDRINKADVADIVLKQIMKQKFHLQ